MRLLCVVVLVVAQAASAADMSYDQAKARADRDEASLSPEQAQQLVESQGKAGGEAHAACVSPSSKADLSPYTVVMQLDANGKVVKTWRHGTSVLAICFDKQMSKKSLFVPPRAPFYTSFEMSWNQ